MYAFKPAALKVRKLDAKAVGGELERLHKRGTGLTPQAVVDAARPESSPMHGAFTWDDSVAAEKYRLGEASYLISAIVIVPDDTEPEEISVVIEESPRAFHNVRPEALDEVAEEHGPETRRGVYQPHEDVMRDPYLRAQLLGQAMSSLTAWARKYRHLDELRKVIEAADQVAAQLELPETKAA